jgi:hypothetical protein
MAAMMPLRMALRWACCSRDMVMGALGGVPFVGGGYA